LPPTPSFIQLPPKKIRPAGLNDPDPTGRKNPRYQHHGQSTIHASRFKINLRGLAPVYAVIPHKSTATGRTNRHYLQVKGKICVSSLARRPQLPVASAGEAMWLEI
jgi:hypothetical protein